MLREEHPGPALRARSSGPGDPVPLDSVERPLEARRALLGLLLRHHLPSFFLGSAFFASGLCSAFFSSKPEKPHAKEEKKGEHKPEAKKAEPKKKEGK